MEGSALINKGDKIYLCAESGVPLEGRSDQGLRPLDSSFCADRVEEDKRAAAVVEAEIKRENQREGRGFATAKQPHRSGGRSRGRGRMLGSYRRTAEAVGCEDMEVESLSQDFSRLQAGQSHQPRGRSRGRRIAI